MKFPRTTSRASLSSSALIGRDVLSCSESNGPDTPRRRLLSGLLAGAVGALGLAVLAGCQTPPASTSPARPGTLNETQRQALQRLGFQQVDQGWELNLSMSLLFDFDSVLLHGAQRAQLQKLGQSLIEIGIAGLRVEGHTDSIGKADYNQRLSLRRAEAVAQALQASGLPFKDLQVRGLGMERPIADNGSETGRAQNRRVALIVAG